MPAEFDKNNPQSVWQNQPTEAFTVSAETLRLRAQKLDWNGRRTVLLVGSIGIILFFYFGWSFVSFADKFQSFALSPFGAWSMRVGFGLLSLWGLYSGYKTYTIFWPARVAHDDGLKTTLQSYRQQLEKRRDYSQNIWLQSGLIFGFLGMAMIVVPFLIRDFANPSQFLNLVPLFALFILWLVIATSQRKRRERKLQQEIDQLHAFENEQRA